MSKRINITTAMALAAMMMAPAMIPAAAHAEDGPDKKPRGQGGPEMMIEKMDANKDGVVSLDEFLEAHKTRFTEIDTDKSGTLTPEEIKAHHEAKRGEWKEKREKMEKMKEYRGGKDKPAE